VSLQHIYSQIGIVSTMESHKPGMFGLASLSEFVDRASGLIGNETWEDDLDGLYRSYLHYRLAEQQYVPNNSGRAAAFRITRSPGSGQILQHEAEYYLVKNTQH
jgi:hypothetical protein